MRGERLRDAARRSRTFAFAGERRSQSERGQARADERRSQSERGQTLLEFAFAAPLLLVFLLAIVDFGIAIDRRIVLDHAVREGVRFASVGGDAFDSGVPTSLQRIRDFTAAQSQGIVYATPTIDNYIDVCTFDFNENGVLGDIGDEIRVVAYYEHDFVTGFTSFFSPSLLSITMQPSASARIEQPPPADVPSTTELAGCPH